MTQELPNYQAIANSLDIFLTENPETEDLVLGSQHSDDIANLKILGSPQVLHVLQKHNYFNIALEARHEFQDGANRVANGKITPEQLGQEAVKVYSDLGLPEPETVSPIYEARGNLVAASSQYGTDVHFVESQSENLVKHDESISSMNSLIHKMDDAVSSEMGAVDTLTNTFTAWAKDKLGMDESSVRGYEAERSEAARKSNIYSVFEKKITTDRISGDSELAQNIKTAADGQKSVVYYGKTHGGHNDNDLDEHLGSNTARLQLVGNEKAFWISSQMDYGRGHDMPSGYLNTNDGKFVSGDEAYKIAEKYDHGVQIKTEAQPKLEESHPTPQTVLPNLDY